MFQYRRLDLLLLKNTAMTVLPALIILTVILCGISYFKLFQNLEFEKIDTLHQLDVAYEDNIRNVELTLDRADYLGYDYYLDGKKNGRYYYSFMDDKCLILLIKSDEDVLLDYTVKGRMKLDNTLYDYILGQCAEDMGITTEQLKSVTYDYVISEAEYPAAFSKIIKVAVIFVIGISLFTVFEGIIWIFLPWRHPQIKNTHGIGEPKLAVRDINRQMHDALMLKQGNVMVTRKYLIVSSLFKTDIIRLRDIEVISKHKERKRSFPWIHGKDVYKLIISNSGDMFYECEFPNEALVDEILPLLRSKKHGQKTTSDHR